MERPSGGKGDVKVMDTGCGPYIAVYVGRSDDREADDMEILTLMCDLAKEVLERMGGCKGLMIFTSYFALLNCVLGVWEGLGFGWVKLDVWLGLSMGHM